MYRSVIWTTAAVGAAVGVFSAILEGAGLMVVMGLIGAMFGAALGGGLYLLIQIVKRESVPTSKRIENLDMDQGIEPDPFAQLKMAQEWMNNRDTFPIAGDPDPAAKVSTGSRDLADIARNRDIFSRD